MMPKNRPYDYGPMATRMTEHTPGPMANRAAKRYRSAMGRGKLRPADVNMIGEVLDVMRNHMQDPMGGMGSQPKSLLELDVERRIREEAEPEQGMM